MLVRLWALILSLRWLIVIPSVVNMALALSSGSDVPPAPAPAAAADIPDAPVNAGFTAIIFAALLKFWCVFCFVSVSPSQGCCRFLQ